MRNHHVKGRIRSDRSYLLIERDIAGKNMELVLKSWAPSPDRACEAVRDLWTRTTIAFETKNFGSMPQLREEARRLVVGRAGRVDEQLIAGLLMLLDLFFDAVEADPKPREL